MGENKKSKVKDGKRELGQVVRFAIVGVSNFLVDFVIFNLLSKYVPSLSAVWAGIISGTAAMINSFIFNKNFTFKAKNLSVFRLVLFFLITAFGLYAIRPAIIYFFTQVWLWPSQIAYDVTSWLNLPFSKEFDTRNVALVIAIVLVLFYNYLMYKYFVFENEKK